MNGGVYFFFLHTTKQQKPRSIATQENTKTRRIMFGSDMELFETTMAVESVVHTTQSQRALHGGGVGTPSRYEKSLGLLTVKFVSLLQEAENGVLDLKVAADSLAVRQKRRIYDITNVLEGVGLIEKKNKNMIQWRGENTACQSKEVQGQLEVLKAQISELEVQEKELDNQKAWLEENIAHLTHDPITSAYKFVTHEDICNAFSGETLLAVVAPSGTQLEVPLPETAPSGQKKYQVNLRSHTAPIQVMLINRESESCKPLVFSVPPVCSAMPTPPSTPTSLQRVSPPAEGPTPSNSFSSATESSSFAYSQDSSFCSDHQMALPEHDDMLTPSSSPPDAQMEFHFESPPALMQQMLSGPQQTVLAGQDILDIGSLLKLNTAGDHLKVEREEVVDLIDELMSTDGVDYNFNLDDNEGVCDLFDVQILNY